MTALVPIEKRERVVKAAVEWVYDQSCSHSLVELEDAVTEFIGQPLDRTLSRQPHPSDQDRPV